jgi:hypothetical protein
MVILELAPMTRVINPADEVTEWCKLSGQPAIILQENTNGRHLHLFHLLEDGATKVIERCVKPKPKHVPKTTCTIFSHLHLAKSLGGNSEVCHRILVKVVANPTLLLVNVKARRVVWLKTKVEVVLRQQSMVMLAELNELRWLSARDPRTGDIGLADTQNNSA